MLREDRQADFKSSPFSLQSFQNTSGLLPGDLWSSDSQKTLPASRHKNTLNPRVNCVPEHTTRAGKVMIMTYFTFKRVTPLFWFAPKSSRNCDGTFACGVGQKYSILNNKAIYLNNREDNWKLRQLNCTGKMLKRCVVK